MDVSAKQGTDGVWRVQVVSNGEFHWLGHDMVLIRHTTPQGTRYAKTFKTQEAAIAAAHLVVLHPQSLRFS